MSTAELWFNDEKSLAKPLAGGSGTMNANLTGPGYYNSKVLPVKESFNYGHVPFGSSAFDRQTIKRSAL